MDKRDTSAEAPEETEARKFGLAYIKLDGNIGCLVNGAGLAMASMDIIKHKGGLPANFLDIGGGASAEKVAAALRIILADPQVKTVLINIFVWDHPAAMKSPMGSNKPSKNSNLKSPL